MCTQDCRTWLWGGNGNPTYDGQGQCSCVCEDQGWSDHNLLGRASCVPVMAHLAFGWITSVVSAAALCHAAYHLSRQLEYHARELMASALPVEKCRRLLHLLVVVFNIMCISFCCTVLGDEARWSSGLLSAMQIPANLCGVSATRIWIYTTGHGLVDRSPEMLALSAWLETPVGYYAACSAVSIAPAVATILAAFGYPEAAMKTTAVGILFVSTSVTGVFWICGKSLIRVIDESLEKKKKTMKSLGDVKSGAHGDQILLAARRKAKLMLGFFTRQLVLMGPLLLFAIFSKYGTAAPLLLFDIPMAIVTILKLAVAVQIFAGRSKVNAPRGLRYGSSGQLRLSRASASFNLRKKSSVKGQVVPTIEGPSAVDLTPTSNFTEPL